MKDESEDVQGRTKGEQAKANYGMYFFLKQGEAK